MFRLHIDVPLDMTQEDAIKWAQSFQFWLTESINNAKPMHKGFFDSKILGVRLGCDTDRQRSNYLQINENGHCSNRKTVIEF